MPAVIVIGAGPAGLAAGIARAKAGYAVTVLERNAAAGRKLMLSGTGQCNITHGGTVADFLPFYSSKKSGTLKARRFVKPALYHFDNNAVRQFFEQQGVPLRQRDDGKVFPQSMRAADIRSALIRVLRQYGGQVNTDTLVQSVQRCEDGTFEVQTIGGIVAADVIVIATGGKSYPKTGSTGSGFDIAKSLGHTIAPPKPALTPVFIKDYAFAACSGNTLIDVPVEILRSGKSVGKRIGTVLFTHTGLSGPCILNISRNIETGDTMKIQLVPPETLSAIYTGSKQLKTALHGIGLPDTLLKILFAEHQDILPLQCAEIRRNVRQVIEKHLLELTVTVERLGSWNEAMVTAGGVDIGEVNCNTMESRLVANLYFAGEVLDIDGETGGYNLHFALASGMLGYRP